MATKRITISINQSVDEIRDQLLKKTGIKMSYVQIFNYLIYFYIKHNTEPRTQWK